MAKKDIKISKGKTLTETSGGLEVAAGETVIRGAHWEKLKAKKSEKSLIKTLKANDKRKTKA